MTVKTIRDRILVLPADGETKTSGGLFIPDNAEDGPIKGTVVSAGSGRVTEDGTIVPLEVFVGNTVLYSKGTGHTVRVDDVEHVVLIEDQIIAIVE